MILYLTVEGKMKERRFYTLLWKENEKTMIFYLTVEGKMKEG